MRFGFGQAARVRRFIRTDALKPWAEKGGGAQGRSLRPLGMVRQRLSGRPGESGTRRPSSFPPIRVSPSSIGLVWNTPPRSTAIYLKWQIPLRRKCESPDQGTALLASSRLSLPGPRLCVSLCSTPPAHPRSAIVTASDGPRFSASFAGTARELGALRPPSWPVKFPEPGHGSDERTFN